MLPLQSRAAETPYIGDALVINDQDPFKAAELVEVPQGLTIREILLLLVPDEALWQYVRVYIQSVEVFPQYWHCVRPKTGKRIVIEILPQGGDDEGGKGLNLRTFLLVAVIAASFAIPAALPASITGTTLLGSGAAALTVGKLISAGITIAGGLLVNAIAPPPSPKTDSLQGGSGTPSIQDSPTLFITGTRNQAIPFGVVPRNLGKRRIVPAYGALPYTEIEGDQQYLRLLFDAGYGPITIEDMKIGETPIENFSEVEVETRQGFTGESPVTLYTNQVVEQTLSILLKSVDDWHIRRSELGVDELSVDATWFRGLVWFDPSGDKRDATVDIDVEYSLVGSGVWRGGQQSFGARNSPVVATGSDELVRKDMIAIHQATGEILVIQGTSVPVTAEPPKPLTKSYQIPLATVRRSGSGFIQSGDIEDARTSDCPCFNPATDFTVTATSPPTHQVLVGAGTLRKLQITATARTTSAVRRSVRWGVERGQYDVRVRRRTPDLPEEQTRTFDEVTWSALRSITCDPPTKPDFPTAQVAMRIKATEELNGTVDQFNFVGQSIIPDWDKVSGVWKERPTSNNASCFREVLTGVANARRVTLDRLNLNKLQEWHEYCELQGLEYNMNRDFRATVPQVLRDITGVGRASLTLDGNQYSVVIDNEKPVVSQMFTPRNTSGYSVKKVFPVLPHAFRVKFFNRDTGWQPDTRIVYFDGYDETNATEFEVLDLPEVTDPEHAWKEGRYRLAEISLRPQEHTFTTGPEYLLARRGSRITVSHTVIAAGISWGRIKSLELVGSEYLSLTADESLETRLGESLVIVVRRPDNTQQRYPVASVPDPSTPGFTHVLQFQEPVPNTDLISVGDLFQYGVEGKVNRDLIIHSIEPRAEISAKITAKDYSPEIFLSDQGPIPPFNSNVTLRQGVASPAVIDIRSDETVLIETTAGVFTPRIALTIGFLQNRPVDATGIQVRYKAASDIAGSYAFVTTPGFVPEISILGVDTGETYVFQLRYVRGTGFSDWGPEYSEQVIGTRTLPPDVQDLFKDNQIISWRYGSPPRDFAGFRLKQLGGNVTNWAAMIAIHEGLVTNTSYTLPDFKGGVRTIGVKAVDVAGNESANMARLVINLGDIPVENIVTTEDFGAQDYPGQIINGTVNTGTKQLFADQISDLLLGGPSADDQIMLPNGASLLLEDPNYHEMSYTTQVRIPVAEMPVAGVKPSSLALDLEVQGLWEIFYRSGTDPILLPVGGDLLLGGPSADADPLLPYVMNAQFNNWPGSIVIRDDTPVFEFKLVTLGGEQRGIIDQYIAVIDAPDESEFIGDVAVPSSGTRLQLTKSYREIRSVTMTLQDDGGDAFTAKVIDKNPTLGPLVETYRQNGQNSSGTIDAFVGGIAGTPP